VNVALIGGTGSFGTALAVRLQAAGYGVVIGSRDAERAQAAAAELGGEGANITGATNDDAARGADLVVLTTKADGAVETARSLREAIGTTPVLSVAAELSFTKEGVLPTGEATSIAARIQNELDGPVIAGLHSLAASNLGGDEAPDEDTLVCGDDAEAKALVPTRECSCARRNDGRDRQREQALQGARRPPRHRRPLTRATLW
jgi:NADPH-dependent F420 reductase